MICLRHLPEERGSQGGPHPGTPVDDPGRIVASFCVSERTSKCVSLQVTALWYCISTLFYYQPSARNTPSWSSSYYITFVFVCLSVRLSQSWEAWERACGVAAGCFELPSLFTSWVQKEV